MQMKSGNELRAEVFEMLEIDVDPDQYGNISKHDWKRIHTAVQELTMTPPIEVLDDVVQFIENMHGMQAERNEETVNALVVDNLARDVVEAVDDEFASEFTFEVSPSQHVGLHINITIDEFVHPADADA